MALLTYLNLAEYVDTTEYYLPQVFSWQIRQMTLKNRLAAIKKYECFLLLASLATSKKINYQEAEIISWLDNIVIIKRLINYFSFQEQINLSLILEYQLRPSKKRIDVVIYRGAKLFVIECSYHENTSLLEAELAQARTYKNELIDKYPNSKVDCAILAFAPEYTQNKERLEDNIKNNEALLKELALKIKDFFWKDKETYEI